MGLGHHLNKYSCAALSDIGSGAVQFHLSVMDDQFRPSFIRKAHAHAGIFHGTGNSRRPGLLSYASFTARSASFKAVETVRDLSVGKHLPGFNGIAVADFPRRDAYLLCKKIDVGFQGKLALAYAESPVRPGRRVICIISVAPDICILSNSRALTEWVQGPLQNRSAQGSVSPCIKINLAVHPCKYTVFITAQGKCPFHGVALGMEIDGLLPGKNRYTYRL